MGEMIHLSEKNIKEVRSFYKLVEKKNVKQSFLNKIVSFFGLDFKKTYSNKSSSNLPNWLYFEMNDNCITFSGIPKK